MRTDSVIANEIKVTVIPVCKRVSAYFYCGPAKPLFLRKDPRRTIDLKGFCRHRIILRS